MTASMKIHEAPFDGDYYVGQTKTDYYTNGGEPPGRWFGEGARALSLHGNVIGKDFTSVLNNIHPRTGRMLAPTKVKATKSPFRSDGRIHQGKPLPEPERKPVAAIDVCFSWKKEDSILYILSDTKTKQAMDAAARKSLNNVLTWLESNVPLTRRGKGGRLKEFAKLVTAVFDQSTNRNNQIQKHHHVVIASSCLREDGTWARINTAALREYVRMLGPLWQAEFTHELREVLGIKHEKLADPVASDFGHEPAPSLPRYSIPGIPVELVDAWSSRRAEILADLAGDLDLGNNTSACAKSKAALKTRGAKLPVPSPDELSKKCVAEAAQYGFTPADARRLLGQAQAIDVDQAYSDAKSRALTRITHGEAHFTQRKLVTAIAEEIQEGGIRAEELLDRVAYDLHHSPELMPLAERNGEMRFTTREMWNLEERLIGIVQALHNRSGALATPETIAITLANHPEATAEQRRTAEYILSQPGGLHLSTGVAGSGKSRTMAIIREAVEREGYQCLGTAVSGAAAEELAAKTGAHCRTLASLLHATENNIGTGHSQSPLLDAKKVVFGDEIGMFDTRSMVRLLEQVHKTNATLIGLGDGMQLPPIMAGSPLGRMKKEVGHTHLVKNQRQECRADQMAAIQIRRGHAEKALAQYADRDRVIVAQNKSEAVRELITAWAKAGGTERPQDHMIFVQTRREAKVINQLCQAERHRSLSTRSLKAVTVGQVKLTPGDRVMFHERLRELHIQNGYRGTVLDVSIIRQTVTIRLDHAPQPRTTKQPLSPIVVVPLRDLSPNALTLGFAATTHKLQGQSIPHAYALTGSTSNKEMSYTQLTRGVVDTRLFVSVDEAGEDLKDLKKAMKKSVAKDLAHDVVDQAQKRGERPPPPRPDKPAPPRREVKLPRQGKPGEAAIKPASLPTDSAARSESTPPRREIKLPRREQSPGSLVNDAPEKTTPRTIQVATSHEDQPAKTAEAKRTAKQQVETEHPKKPGKDADLPRNRRERERETTPTIELRPEIRHEG